MRNRFPIKSSDALLLAALTLYQKYGRFNPACEETTKETLEKSIDHWIPQKLLNGTFQEIRMRYHNDYIPSYTYKEWAQYIYEQYKDLAFDNLL